MNIAALTGRLTKDPSLQYTQDGKAVSNYTLAVRNPFIENGVDFIPVVTWGKIAEILADTHRKGDFLTVAGRIQTRSYEDNDGNTRYVTEINTDQVTFVGSSHGNDSRQEAQPEPEKPKARTGRSNGNRASGNGNSRGNSPRR